MMEVNSTTRTLQALLAFFYYTEVFFEMAATRSLPFLGSLQSSETRSRRRRRWSTIVAIEAIKAVCKLTILAHNQGRMLVPPTQHEQNLRIIHDSTPLIETTNGMQSLYVVPSKLNGQPNRAVTLSNVQYRSEIRELLNLYQTRGRGSAHPHGLFSLTDIYTHAMESPSHRPAFSAVLAEILYVLRPVIYSFARLCTRDSSWLPFSLSIISDLMSRLLEPSYPQLSPAQRAELGRRMLYWVMYLFRSPFFEHYTQHPLLQLSRTFSRIPIVGMLFTNVVDLVFALRNIYFYTSASS